MQIQLLLPEHGPKGCMLKVFWRLILPAILAVVLAIVLTLEVMGHGGSSMGGSFGLYGPLRYAGACLIGAIFIIFLISSLRNTLKWGKEAEEYKELLKEEEASEARRRRQRDSS